MEIRCVCWWGLGFQAGKGELKDGVVEMVNTIAPGAKSPNKIAAIRESVGVVPWNVLGRAGVVRTDGEGVEVLGDHLADVWRVWSPS